MRTLIHISLALGLYIYTIGSAYAAPCYYMGSTLTGGASITTYSQSQISYATNQAGTTCASISTTLSCPSDSSSTLTGAGGTSIISHPYSTCTISPARSCLYGSTFGQQATIGHMQYRTGYTDSICTTAGRFQCLDGTLTGGSTISLTSYPYPYCGTSTPRSCILGTTTINHGSAITAYQVSDSRLGSCASETRTCNDGILGGSYLYTTCTTQTAQCGTASETYISTNLSPRSNLCLLGTGESLARDTYRSYWTWSCTIPGSSVSCHTPNTYLSSTGTTLPAGYPTCGDIGPMAYLDIASPGLCIDSIASNIWSRQYDLQRTWTCSNRHGNTACYAPRAVDYGNIYTGSIWINPSLGPIYITKKPLVIVRPFVPPVVKSIKKKVWKRKKK